MSRTGPKNFPGAGVSRTKAPKPKPSAPSKPRNISTAPVAPPKGGGAGTASPRSGLARTPSIKTTSHKTARSPMPKPRKADGPSKI